jgi:hypothetical protein
MVVPFGCRGVEREELEEVSGFVELLWQPAACRYGSQMSCSVKGCDEAASEGFVLQAAPLLEAVVCTFHKAALMAGEAWALEDGFGAVLMGEDLALDLISWSETRTVGNDVITLHLGRDGVESQQVSFRADPSMIRAMCHWVAEGDHPDDFYRSKD